MDIESDDSERWEDFFGSSTDLTPSLIGLYDSLTGSLHTKKEIQDEDEDDDDDDDDNDNDKIYKQNGDVTTTLKKDVREEVNSNRNNIANVDHYRNKNNSNSAINENDKDEGKNELFQGNEIITKREFSSTSLEGKIVSSSLRNNSVIVNKSTNKQNFHVLSPNVQRLISHSTNNTLMKKVESSYSVQQRKINTNCSNNSSHNSNNHNFINSSFENNNSNSSTKIESIFGETATTTISSNSSKKTTVERNVDYVAATNSSSSSQYVNNLSATNRLLLKKINGKQKLSHIPLSRNTCKLTQSGNELVETFDNNCCLQSSNESLDKLSYSSHLHHQQNHLQQVDQLQKQQQEQNKYLLQQLNGVDLTKDDLLYATKDTSNLIDDTDIACTNLLKKASNLKRIDKSQSNLEKVHNQEDQNSSIVNKILVQQNSYKEPLLQYKLNSSSRRVPDKIKHLQENQTLDTVDTKVGTDVNSQLVKNNNNSSEINSIKMNGNINLDKRNNEESTSSKKVKEEDSETIQKKEVSTANGMGAIPNSTLTQSPSSPLLTYSRIKKTLQLKSPLDKNPVSLKNNISNGATVDNRNIKNPIKTAEKETNSNFVESSDKKTFVSVTETGMIASMSEFSLSPSTSSSPQLAMTAVSTPSIINYQNQNLPLPPSAVKNCRKSHLVIPDIARLKHRPLSSSSICSTSSSSSSGSDHHPLGSSLKLGTTSYLASVESLADQSENEHLDLGGHINITVLERACKEIIDSERSYVDDLGQVIKGYLEDWKERACLKVDELQILFSNIQQIYEFNSIILKQLINSGMEPAKIAKCFIDFKDRFDIVYTTYCTSYPEAISLLTSLLQASHTNSLLTSTQKMLQHTLPLGSYLLKPVQRILKYHLLLDNLRKHCDIEEVLQAHEIMRAVARNIDQVKKKLEQQSRVKELSGILDGWLGPELTVLGELRQEGLLMENNKPRMVFLFQTMLIITKPKEDNRLQFKTFINRNNLMLREHLPGEPTSFNVIPYDEPRNQIKLTAKNRDQKRLWAQNIKSVILEQFNIPNRAKELVYKLGDEEDRTPDKNIWKWSLHSSTPVYLERRNQCRRSEMRNRSKLKRKTITNTSSVDAFNSGNKEQKSSPNGGNSLKEELMKLNKSLDDNMIPTLGKLSDRTFHQTTTDNICRNKDNCHKDIKSTCNCNESDSAVGIHPSHHRHRLGSNKNKMKERSKSVPRLSSSLSNVIDETEVNNDNYSFDRSNYHLNNCSSHKNIQEEDLNESNKRNEITCFNRSLSHLSSSSSSNNSSKGGSKGNQLSMNTTDDIRTYNMKTIPKRIANMKKQHKARKETSIFYTDLNDSIEETVLKITESSENLHFGNNNKTENETSISANETNEKSRNESDHLEEPTEILKTIDELSKRDVEIISELLKEHKEFHKILKKPPKKRSLDNGNRILPTSPEPGLIESPLSPLIPPPPPPSNSPPPLDEIVPTIEDKKKRGFRTDFEDSDHIYESLLRNVHVPYKYSSPVLNRSKSQQYYTNTPKIAVPQRPESDYVTLIYSGSGNLKSIDGISIKGNNEINFKQNSNKNNNPDALRNSDTNINYNASVKRDLSEKSSLTDSENIPVSSEMFSSFSDLKTQNDEPGKLQKSLLQRLIHCKNENVTCSTSETSLLPKSRKCSGVDMISLNFASSRLNRPPERRVSDVSEMCRQSFMHRQGSEALGERMANLDYADPRTLFSSNNTTLNSSLSKEEGVIATGDIMECNKSINNSETSLNPQRDSVFSLTSSSDSVCDNQKQNESINFISSGNVNSLKLKEHYSISSAANNMASLNNFIYETSVEECLENDFRDSAVYSDDNERRAESLEDDDETGLNENMKFVKESLSTELATKIEIQKQTMKSLLPKFNKNKRIIENANEIHGSSNMNSINDETRNTCLPKNTIPPPIATKPSNIPLKRLNSSQRNEQISKVESNSPQLLSPRSEKSWVLQQIENFNK